jgi:YfiH family protein
LSALGGVRHAFFTRAGGVSEGVGSNDVADNVTENRKRMAAALGVAPAHLLTAYQVHSPTVAMAERPWSQNERPRADAIVTTTPGLAVGISTADCGPVLMADAQACVVGAAHAGWRGALAGVLEATVAAMERVGAERRRMVAALGPTISQANYEVGPEVVAQFVADDPASAGFFVAAERGGYARFDLPGYILSRLRRASVGSIEDLGRCTYAEPDAFYSFRRCTHRREADYGRHISGIVLAQGA